MMVVLVNQITNGSKYALSRIFQKHALKILEGDLVNYVRPRVFSHAEQKRLTIFTKSDATLTCAQ